MVEDGACDFLIMWVVIASYIAYPLTFACDPIPYYESQTCFLPLVLYNTMRGNIRIILLFSGTRRIVDTRVKHKSAFGHGKIGCYAPIPVFPTLFVNGKKLFDFQCFSIKDLQIWMSRTNFAGCFSAESLINQVHTV